MRAGEGGLCSTGMDQSELIIDHVRLQWIKVGWLR
jgi:hypothetical protein